MRVSDSSRLLFVHVPKTGGITIEKILAKCADDLRVAKGPRHHTLATVLEAEPDLTNYWIFGFVRNPWARMVSWWSMISEGRRKADAGDEDIIRQFRNRAVWRAAREYPDFETFVVQGCDEIPRLRIPQIDYLTAGDRRADFIGRTETFASDVNVVRERLGVAPTEEIPHKNVSSHGHYHDYYTPATRDRIATVYRSDIDEFGYEY